MKQLTQSQMKYNIQMTKQYQQEYGIKPIKEQAEQNILSDIFKKYWTPQQLNLFHSPNYHRGLK